MTTLSTPLFAQLLVAAALAASLSPARAQSFCASDGQSRPVQLMERFINADCDTCWTDPATPVPAKNAVVLDWVAPGGKGDDAPLSAVATRDALVRLETLRQGVPARSQTLVHAAKGIQGAGLRVAHGLPVADYLGASIELRPVSPTARQPLTAWLALVETLPAGLEGSPVERNLVRNVLSRNWDGRNQLLKREQNRLFESRSMSIAPGANSDRLRVIGWVEDEKGRVLLAAQSRCIAP
ncbi:hypothetical protein [Polaromonas sp. CG9_12]|uniref:hypothetical protein n=1 Tax=Polaromonas sp. CG_9.11 TaxID=2787730 RepID=UPI0004DDCBBD|nr:hypothetical protein [Polaromonas sp. CG_9.11]MBG6074304.1 hypothetical protein [Polaromonas sp. CG_9.11]CDS54432.1 hypothetical protein [Polaromonas sp. CG9_12]